MRAPSSPTPKSRSRGPQGEMRERIFRYVEKRLLEGRPPTVREVRDHLGLRAVQTVQRHLNALVEQGRLLRDDSGRARTLQLPRTRARGPVSQVPVLGRVQAGALTTAVEEIEGYVAVGREAQGLFALRVRGMSMSGAAILPGDLLIIRQQADADDGDIVVALVDEEATVKRLRKRGRVVELHPENEAFEIIRADDIQVLGKVLEVRRALE